MDGEEKGKNLRSHFRIFLTLVMSVALVSCSGGGEEGFGPEARFLPPVPEGGFGDTNYIVKFAENSSALSASAHVTQSQANQLYDSGAFGTQVKVIKKNLHVVKYPSGSDVEGSLVDLLQNENVEYIEPDYPVYALGRPNDPQLSEQYAHDLVKSFTAWDLTVGDSNVVVGVIDTGIDYNHPDLRANMWINSEEVPNNGRDDDGNGYVDDYHGYDFANNDGNPIADDQPSYHGTHVAGTIGAVGDNGVGISGHAQKVKLMALKFLKGNGSGSTSDAIRAIDYAIAQGVHILSNSWGGGGRSRALEDAIVRARNAGILFVAAAGNGGSDGIGDDNDRTATYPANYNVANVVSVAATDQSDQLTRFSNYGATKVSSGSTSDAIRAIDYAIAQGVHILSNSWGGGGRSRALEDAIVRARNAGILFVAAAGNGGSDGIGDDNDRTATYPANYNVANVVSVAATDQSDQLTRFSNYGATKVHVAAPGFQIVSTANNGRYQSLSGTSMATPLVSGSFRGDLYKSTFGSSFVGRFVLF